MARPEGHVAGEDERALEDGVAQLRDAYHKAKKERAWGSLALNLVLEDGWLETAEVQEKRTTRVKGRGKG
jgi:hypothetical protein